MVAVEVVMIPLGKNSVSSDYYRSHELKSSASKESKLDKTKGVLSDVKSSVKNLIHKNKTTETKESRNSLQTQQETRLKQPLSANSSVKASFSVSEVEELIQDVVKGAYRNQEESSSRSVNVDKGFYRNQEDVTTHSENVDKGFYRNQEDVTTQSENVDKGFYRNQRDVSNHSSSDSSTTESSSDSDSSFSTETSDSTSGDEELVGSFSTETPLKNESHSPRPSLENAGQYSLESGEGYVEARPQEDYKPRGPSEGLIALLSRPESDVSSYESTLSEFSSDESSLNEESLDIEEPEQLASKENPSPQKTTHAFPEDTASGESPQYAISAQFKTRVESSVSSSSEEFSSSSSEEGLPIEDPLIKEQLAKEGISPTTMKKLAHGSFKEVFTGRTYDQIPGSKYVPQRGSPKEFVYIKAKGNTKLAEDELTILKKINESIRESQKGSKRNLVKHYVIKDDLIIANRANLGEIKNVMPVLADNEKAIVMLYSLKALKHLHSINLIHNDFAPRNILAHVVEKYVKPDANALGSILGKDVIIDGKRIVKSGTVLEQRHIDRLNKHQTGDIKVYTLDLQGLLTDFGSAEDISKANRKGATHALDIVAPEVFYGEGYGQSADLFSVGQTLADVYLHGGRDSDLSKVTEYTQMARKRFEARKIKYKELRSKNFETKGASALKRSEYLKLKKIDVELARIIRGLMNYNPAERPSLEEAEKVLTRLAKTPKS